MDLRYGSDPCYRYSDPLLDIQMKHTIKIFALFVLAFVATAFDCGGGNSNTGTVPDPTYTGSLSDKYAVTSPKGVVIHSGTSIAANVPQIVDQQLDDLFRIAQAPPNNYKPCPGGTYDDPNANCFSTYATYHVWLVPRAPQCETPGFTVLQDSAPWPDGYDNDPNGWDKDPRPGHTLLCVAGFMATGGSQMKGLQAPGMAVVDAIDQMPIIRYEGEHNLLAQADPNRYGATQFHTGTNGGHPILGNGPATMKGRMAPARMPDIPKKVTDAHGDQLLITK